MPSGQLPSRLRSSRLRPVARLLARAVREVDLRLYRAGRRTVGGRIAHADSVLVLTTVGRRTNRPHVTPLLYSTEHDGYLVVAANGGADWDPDWLLNLVANPEAEVDVDGEKFAVHASVLDEKSRLAAWSTATAAFPGLADAQASGRRTIPLVRLITTQRRYERDGP